MRSTVNFFAAFNKWWFIVIFGFGGAWLFILLYQKFSRFRPTFPRLDFDFQILEKEVSYEYVDKTHMIYRKKNFLRALKNNLDTYHDKYHWTGSGKVKIKSEIKEQQFIETIRKNVWQFYEIRFQKTLKKGEEIETEVIWELEDVAGKAVPFFSATIEEPTDALILNLCLSPGLGVKEAVCEISSGIGAKKPFSSEILKLNRDGWVTWKIRKPKLLHHYEMKWTI